MPEDEKEILKQCLEGTNISKSFARNTCFAPVHKFEHKAPKSKTKKVSNLGYTYRRFTLSEGGKPMDVVVRSQIDAYDENSKGKKKFLLLKTFNQ